MTQYTKGLPDPRVWYAQRLDPIGDGTGDPNAIGDYSDTGLGMTYFRAQANGRALKLTGLSIKIQATGQMRAEEYGTLSRLTNGVSIVILAPNDEILMDWMGGEPVKSNGDWGEYTTNFRITDFGSGDNFVAVGFRVPNVEEPIYLPPGFSLAMQLHDDFTGLGRHVFTAFGQYARQFG